MINVQIEIDQKLVKLKEKSIIKLVSVVMKSEDIKTAEILLIFTNLSDATVIKAVVVVVPN